METSPLEDARAARIAELERSLARTSGVGVKPLVAAVAIVLSVGLLWHQRLDVGYYFGPRAPITLGSEGDYRLDALRTNRYAQVHGIPSTRGAYSQERGETFMVVGLRDTPLLVHRRVLPGEVPPASPNQTPFAVRGRLLAREDAQRFEDGFKLLSQTDEVRPRDGRLWILLEGERPGADAMTALVTGALAGFAMLNSFFLWRGLTHRVRRAREARKGA